MSYISEKDITDGMTIIGKYHDKLLRIDKKEVLDIVKSIFKAIGEGLNESGLTINWNVKQNE